MSPEKARVFVAEDNKAYQKIIQEYLEEAGHSVVLRATTYRDAIDGIKTLENLGVDVAILDGNLTRGEDSGDEGQLMLRAIRAVAPRVRTVGMSASSVRGTDVDLGKFKVEEIGNVVTKL